MLAGPVGLSHRQGRGLTQAVVGGGDSGVSIVGFRSKSVSILGPFICHWISY